MSLEDRQILELNELCDAIIEGSASGASGHASNIC